jgi:hypothetical protein
MRSRLALAAAVVLAASAPAQQMADNAFDMSVAKPAHTTRNPNVVLDEAHNNFHTISGRYAPWAKLMRNDGVSVSPSTKRFSAATLTGVDVLVISNPVAPGMAAGGATLETATSAPAFTDAECDAVRDWVQAGGSLLLIADHAPFGSAAEVLSLRFGVDFGKGFVYDRENFVRGRGPTMLVFEGERLGAHSITAATAGESPSREELAEFKGKSAAGRAQGIALTFGKGRVVMLGEAAMMSAQIAAGARDLYGAPLTMGMNFPGNDDKQFALNVMRWLTGILP